MKTPDQTIQPLFTPLKVGGLEVPGRLWKAATSETRANDDGTIGEEYISFYEPMAWAGTPLIITGNLYVSLSGKPTWRNAGIDDDDKLPGLMQLTERMHQHGSKIIAQINHCGRQKNAGALDNRSGNLDALAPSAVRDKVMLVKPREMTVAEIERTIDDFAAAAFRAKQASFDGVQIHLAHGYLLCEFLTPHTNRRSDQYGGTFEKRLRVPLDVLRAVRERVGPEFPVLAKINGADLLVGSDGNHTATLVEIAQRLQDEGLDGLEISCGHYESGFPMIRGRFDTFFDAQMSEGGGQFLARSMRLALRVAQKPIEKAANKLWPPQEGFNLAFAREFKRALDIPVICVGGFHSAEGMANAISDEGCDAISLGRAMIADPFLVKHLREGSSGPQCDWCNGCIARAGGMPVDCYNPKLQSQREAMLAQATFTTSAAA